MVEILDTPPNEKVIDEVWIALSEDDDGKNGIIAALLPGLGSSPMVTSLARLVPFFIGQSDALKSKTGQRIKIYRFARIEEVYDTGPDK